MNPIQTVRTAFTIALLSLISACPGTKKTGSEGDPGRPRLVIVSPESGSTLDQLSAELRLRVEDAAASGYSWRVNGGETVETAVAIPAGEEIEAEILLAEGLNTLVVSVSDDQGEADSETLYVLASLVPVPLVTVTSVSDDEIVFTEAVQVEGTVESEQVIESATLTVNAGTPQAVALSGSDGSYTFSVAVNLVTGANALSLSVTNDHDRTATYSLIVYRDVDEADPVISLLFPRDNHAVKTRRVLVKGSVSDNDGISGVWLEKGETAVEADLDEDGNFTAWLDLDPAGNAYSIHATDFSGNEAVLERDVYFGQRLGAGGAFGGAIRSGEIYAWGRNNLGQTGLDYVSHESQTAWCDRVGLSSPFEIAACKATTLTAINALCDSSWAGDSGAIATCKSEVAAKRAAVCTAAGASAPANCGTSSTANLWTACTAAYGTGTPASSTCKVDLVCNSPYAGESRTANRTLCTSTVNSVPSTYPAPATPYSATKVTGYSTAATPAAATGTGATFASLGTQFISLAFNQNAASALDSAGNVWGWGDGANGMLCLGDTNTDADQNDRKIPHRVAPFGAEGTKAIAISRGYDHLLILRSDGTVWGCGLNNLGQIGDGTFGTANNRQLPTQVQGLPANIVQVHASSASSYALTSGGLIYAWGRNQYGNLGQGTVSGSTAAQTAPLLVPGLTDVAVIGGGRDHMLAAKANGTVWAWGLNASNQVGPDELTTPGGNPVTSPVQVPGITDAVAVYGNGNQGFYEDVQGRLWGWGQNGSGNLGIPEDEDQPAPTVPVFGLSGVVDVAIGALHGFVIMPTSEGDKTFSWGWSFHGSLGGGTALIHTWAYRTPMLVQFP